MTDQVGDGEETASTIKNHRSGDKDVQKRARMSTLQRVGRSFGK